MKLGEKRRGATFLKVFASLLIGVLVNLSLAASAFAATFPANAPTLGAISDGGPGCGANGANKDVTFTVSGLSGSVATAEVSMTFAPAHTWMADVTATLIAPNAASKVLFGYTGSTTALGCGDSSDLAGPYNFKDTAAAPPSGGWWQAATAAGATVALATGDYRSTDTGGAGAVNPQPATSINPAFTGVANANGTWTLRLTDGGAADTGSISAATLTITTTSAAGVGVSGRVLTSAGGRGLVGARVFLTDQNGSTRTAVTTKGGRYIFDDLEPGQTYVLSVSSRLFSFQPQVIQVTDNIAELNFIPE